MHPLLILVPAAALLFGPRLWVRRVLDRHHHDDASLSGTGGEVARALLDRHGLQAVRVEITDMGDHYDPQARAVRLTRDKFDRKTLTAITTAAHEVGHALQHANDYSPFIWRTHLANLSRVTGQAGSLLLLTIPVTAITARQPLHPVVIGATVLAIIGVGVAAQLVALPTEIDASFRRALPMLRNDCIGKDQVDDASKILTACSYTYVASSLLAILTIWPWLGRGPIYIARPATGRVVRSVAAAAHRRRPRRVHRINRGGRHRSAGRGRDRAGEALIRLIGKPLVRSWFWCANNL